METSSVHRLSPRTPNGSRSSARVATRSTWKATTRSTTSPSWAPPGEPAAPDGYRLRTIEPTDLEQRVEIHRTVWTPSRVTAESFANVQAAWPYRRDLDCVVEAPDGSFAAYCLAWLDDANRVGQFEPVGTHPDYHRRGLATAVCRFALLRLREEGATRAIVYSLEGFGGGTALYESIGMREHARSVELVKRR